MNRVGPDHWTRAEPSVAHERPLRAKIVAKVENRATRKISRKSIFRLPRPCVAFRGHHGGPWSILDETMWSLTSPRAKRISGCKKFRSSPQKDFCNNIDPEQTCGATSVQMRIVIIDDGSDFCIRFGRLRVSHDRFGQCRHG
jgi:hypothetical protein